MPLTQTSTAISAEKHIGPCFDPSGEINSQRHFATVPTAECRFIFLWSTQNQLLLHLLLHLFFSNLPVPHQTQYVLRLFHL
jgi:hypothetical protein